MICTANQFRSPLAAACLLEAIRAAQPAGRWVVESAGTWARAGLPAPGLARQIASRIGLPGLESHRTRQVDSELLSRYDLSIVMEAGHKEALRSEFPALKERVYLLSEIVDGFPYDIPDPAAPGVDPDEVADELKRLIDKGLNQILRLAESLSADARSL
jgi:protein-tyrosine phosphatase